MPSKHRYPTIRLSSAVYEQLFQPYGEAASQCLKRYFWMLDNAVPDFSDREWNLLQDTLLGWVSISKTPETLMESFLFQVEDAISHIPDSEMLITKLRSLSFVQAIATIHVLELSRK